MRVCDLRSPSPASTLAASLVLAISVAACGEDHTVSVSVARPGVRESAAPTESAVLTGTAAPTESPVPTGTAAPPTSAPAEATLEEHVVVDAGAPAVDRFFELEDAPLLDVLAHGDIVRIERGSGGRSVAFRLTFADGSRGYFKPEQTFSGSHWFAEVASYHLDRALGLGRTPPTVARRIPYSRVETILSDDAHRDEVIVGRDGYLRGSLSYWVPERLVSLTMGYGFDRWFRIEGPLYLSPFQRAREYVEMQTGRSPIVIDTTFPEAIEPDRPERGAELSDLVVFDFLTHNIDRWSPDFTNVRTRGAHGPLVYLDNAAGFIEGRARIGFMDRRLHAVQRFRRSTVEVLRHFDMDAYRTRLATEPSEVGEILTPTLLTHLEERRVAVLEHVDAMIAAHGEENVLSL